MQACGGAYTPEQRRKFYITGPQWAAAYPGHALFHAPTRAAVAFEDVIREYGKIFAVPTYFFIVTTLTLIAVGAWNALTGSVQPVTTIAPMQVTAQPLTLFLLLTAFFYVPILVMEIHSPLAVEGINYVGDTLLFAATALLAGFGSDQPTI